MRRRRSGSNRFLPFLLAVLGLGVLLVLTALALAACGTAATMGATTVETGETTTTASPNVTETVMDTGFTTTSSTPVSVPALASRITAEQIKNLVASWSHISAADWVVRDYKTLGDWAAAKLFTSKLPAQIGKDGVGAVFEKRSGAWFFKDWVSVADSLNQQTIELTNMGAPAEVWSYFGVEPPSSSANQSALPEQMPADFAFTAAYGFYAKNVLDTFTGTFTKDIIAPPKPNPTITFRLSAEEMARLYQALVQIGILSYPSVFTPDAEQEAKTGVHHFVDPHPTYSLRVRAVGQERSVLWEDQGLSSAPKAAALRNWFNMLQRMIEARPEYKAMPPTEGGYA